jgi:hypothetical protein
MTAVYWLDGRDSIPGMGKMFFFSSQRPDRCWDPLNILYQGSANYGPLANSGPLLLFLRPAR